MSADPLLYEGPLQQALHDYLTPHPELGQDTDERGCVPCFLIARAIAPTVAALSTPPAEDATSAGSAVEVLAKRFRLGLCLCGHPFNRHGEGGCGVSELDETVAWVKCPCEFRDADHCRAAIAQDAARTAPEGS